MRNNEKDNLTPEPFEINLETEIECYFCGRTTTDIESIIDFDKIKSAVISQFEGRKAKFIDELNNYIESLESLYNDTKSYRGDVLIEELTSNESLIEKIMPRYKDLIVFVGIYRKTNRNIWEISGIQSNVKNIAEIQKVLKIFIQELKTGNYTHLNQHNPYLADKMWMIKEPKIDKLKNKALEFTARIEEFMWDFEGRSLKKEIYSDDDDDDWEIKYIPQEDENDLSVNANEVLRVNLRYYLCPICEKAFVHSSEAAYDVIHANDNDD